MSLESPSIIIPNMGSREVLRDTEDSIWLPEEEFNTDEGFGYVPRDYTEVPEGELEFSIPFDLPIIPRAQWPDLIKKQAEDRSRVSDHRHYHKLKSSNQNPLPYCWIHGCVNAMRLKRAMMRQPYADLEPTAPGALIKNFRRVGGNTPESVKHLAREGCPTTRFWKPNSLSRAQVTPEMKENALLHRITEWYELKRNNFDQLATALLHGFPCVIGLSWWSHMIVAMDLVDLGRGEFGVLIWNSWGDGWKDQGEAVLPERKATAFDQIAVRQVTIRTDFLVDSRADGLQLIIAA